MYIPGLYFVLAEDSANAFTIGIFGAIKCSDNCKDQIYGETGMHSMTHFTEILDVQRKCCMSLHLKMLHI